MIRTPRASILFPYTTLFRSKRFGCRAVVVTDGAAGCAVSCDAFEGIVPAPAVSAVDATGAGDAFLGGLLAGLHHGLGWEDAARRSEEHTSELQSRENLVCRL